MFGAELVVVLLAIYLGARLGGIGIGFAGGLGVLVLTLIFQIKPGAIPFDVIEIIMAVIAAIAAMQVAGGMDYLVSLAERMLRRHPKYITFLAPLVTWFMTILAGTGHTAFSTLPVITEVAKEQGIRPSRPLSIAVVASQIAITASPISAAVVFFAGILEPLGVSYLTLLAICIPVTLIAVMLTAVVCNFLGAELKDDPVYQERLAKGEVSLRGSQVFELKPHAKRAVLLFLIGIVAVMFYATAISDTVGLIQNPVLPRNEAIVVFMLTIATLISITCKIDTSEVLNASTFKSGMSACVCVLGAAQLPVAAGRGPVLCRHPALFPGGNHQSPDAGRADVGRDPADGNRLFCGSLCALRPANLPNPACRRGNGRHRLHTYREVCL